MFGSGATGNGRRVSWNVEIILYLHIKLVLGVNGVGTVVAKEKTALSIMEGILTHTGRRGTNFS